MPLLWLWFWNASVAQLTHLVALEALILALVLELARNWSSQCLHAALLFLASLLKFGTRRASNDIPQVTFL